MAAYVIVRVLEVRDTAWREEYGAKTAALVQKHGGRFLVRGGVKETLEGSAKVAEQYCRFGVSFNGTGKGLVQ